MQFWGVQVHNLSRFVRECLVIAAISSGAAAQANKPLKATASPLDLTVRTDRQSCRMSDTIRMETHSSTPGNEDVYIWDWDSCWNPARGLSVYVKAPDGSPVHGEFYSTAFHLRLKKATCTSS